MQNNKEIYNQCTIVFSTICTTAFTHVFIQKIINFLRRLSYGTTYATSMSPPTAQMALSAMKVIMGEDGTNEGIVLHCTIIV